MQAQAPIHTSSQVTERVLLYLDKYSHCTVSTMTSKPNWNHLIGQGELYALFDTIQSGLVSDENSSKRILKIAQRGYMLEYIELDELKLQAQRDEFYLNASDGNSIMKSTSILFKASQKKVAMRYRTSDEKIRRFQVLFPTDSRFEQCLLELRKFCLPLRDLDNERPLATRASIIQSNQNNHLQPYQPQSSQSQQMARVIQPINQFIPANQLPRIPEWQDSQITSHRYAGTPPASQHSMACHPEVSQEYVSSSQPVIDATQLSYLAPYPAKQALTRDLDRGFKNTQDQLSRLYKAPETEAPIILVESSPVDALLPPKRVLPWVNKVITGKKVKLEAEVAEELKVDADVEQPSVERTPPKRMIKKPVTKKAAPKDVVMEFRAATVKALPAKDVKEFSSNSITEPPIKTIKEPPTKTVKKAPIKKAPAKRAALTKEAKKPPAQKAAPKRKRASQVPQPRKKPATRKPAPDAQPLIDQKFMVAKPFVRARTRQQTKQALATKAPTETEVAGKTLEQESALVTKPGGSATAPTSEPLTPGSSERPNTRDESTQTQARNHTSTAMQTDPVPALMPLGETSANRQNPRRSQPVLVEDATGETEKTKNDARRKVLMEQYLQSKDDILPAPTAKQLLEEYAGKPEPERAEIMDRWMIECLEDENFVTLANQVERNWKRMGLRAE